MTEIDPDPLLACPVGCAFLLTIERDQVPIDLAIAPFEAFSRLASVLRRITPWSGTFDRDVAKLLSSAPRLAGLAREAVIHPGSQWWTSPMNPGQQMVIPDDPSTESPPLEGAPVWESYAERPLEWRFTSTLHGELSCLDTIIAYGVGDWPYDQHQRDRFRAETDESARVLEVKGPADWHSLCTDHPRPNQHRNSPAGEGTLTPDWPGVATQWDGIHLTFLSILTAPFVRLTSEAGTTMMWSWNTEGTLWLSGSFLQAGISLPPVNELEYDIRPLMSGDLASETEQARRRNTPGLPVRSYSWNQQESDLSAE